MMPPNAGLDEPRATVRKEGAEADVILTGAWRLGRRQPSWRALAPRGAIRRIRLNADAVEVWDTSLPLFLSAVRTDCAKRRVDCDLSALPEKMRLLLSQLESAGARARPVDRSVTFLATVGASALSAGAALQEILHFLGECVIALLHAVARPHKFRWKECFDEMQQCGAMALPIVSLIGLLVGLTLAYQGAIELRQFGADIWVADLIGLSVVREMGPVMAAVIVAGRTGAAFAASLGNMKMNEEIDALAVLGVPPIDFLILPRLVAVTFMMPLLALYTDAVGVLGGVVVSASILHIPPNAYWVETQSAVVLSDVTSGVIKAVVFG
ncbi:MAG: MlaE family ABC transporter permease, partial [Opitutaceae bacterium]